MDKTERVITLSNRKLNSNSFFKLLISLALTILATNLGRDTQASSALYAHQHAKCILYNIDEIIINSLASNNY